MPRRCVIINCLTKGSVRNKSMYKFPKDEELCKKWLEAIKNPKLDKIYETDGVYALNKRVFVCSDHFEPKWLRDVNEPSQGLFLGAIPSVSLNMSMDTLLTNLRRCEMYKQYGHPKKMFQRQAIGMNRNMNDMITPMGYSAGGSSLVNCDASGKNMKFPTMHGPGRPRNVNTPIDKATAKDDEELLSLIEKRRMNIKVDAPPPVPVPPAVQTHIMEPKQKKDETPAPVKVRKTTKVKKAVVRKSRVKKLKLRVKGTEKFINVVVTPKAANSEETAKTASATQAAQSSTIKIFVPKKKSDDQEPSSRFKKNNSIKVVIPNSINGEQVQLDRSEISKIINLVSGPRVLGKKRVKSETLKKNVANKTVKSENDKMLSDEPTVVNKCRKKGSELKKSNARNLKVKQMLKISPIKSVYKKTSETNKGMRDFIESYFGEMIKCSCDFTPQENIMNISQRIIELKKKLVNAQKLLSKHKANNRKIATTIDELRKQIPEKPVKPPQKGQLIKCIIPRTKVTNEKYRRGKHRFTKTLKTFALDLFYSSPLSYSILEKIYLLPSRKTLKRWLVHPQNNAPEMLMDCNSTNSNNECVYPPEERNNEVQHNENNHSMNSNSMEGNNMHVMFHHSGMQSVVSRGHPELLSHSHSMLVQQQQNMGHHQVLPLPPPHSHTHPHHPHHTHNSHSHSNHPHHTHSHSHSIETTHHTMGTIEDNIEPLQENIDDIMFRNDLAEAIMNS